VSEAETREAAPRAAQVPFAKKAAAKKKAARAAADRRYRQTQPKEARERHLARAALVATVLADRKDAEARSHASRAPPGGLMLLSKRDVVGIAGVSYITIWQWMQRGTFPRSYVVGGKAMWRSDDVKAWLDALPTTKLKGDKQKEGAAA
jgi:predicted DNA-binding transcriptional regulator AlpA